MGFHTGAAAAFFSAAAALAVVSSTDYVDSEVAIGSSRSLKARPFATARLTLKWIGSKCVRSFRQQLVFFVRELRSANM